MGARWAETLRSLGGLRSHHRVLDVGCGPGRLALALAPWLAECGSYEGFDITPDDIAWCKAEIEPRWPGAHFQLAPVRNAYYNPAGTVSVASPFVVFERDEVSSVAGSPPLIEASESATAGPEGPM
ncbi:MAG: methyltransferase domain-containing protein [Gaiellaceae bacterium]